MPFLRDLRYGFRGLGRNRAFAVAAIGVVARGIGATTAVFSVVQGVVLRPLPYRDPQRIVLFRADLPGYPHQPLLNPEELLALRDQSDLFESVGVINVSEGNFTSPDVMAAATAVSVSDNFFETLGVAPLLGRSVSARDLGTQWVTGIDISWEAWQKHFHGDPGIVGRQIEVNNLPMTVVGVLPRAFALNLGAGVAVPTTLDIFYPRAAGYDRDPARSRIAIARLRSDVTIERVRAMLGTMAARLVADHPALYPDRRVQFSAGTLGAEVVSEVRPALMALTAAVAFVLLVACANLTLLLLTRASSRGRELALRVSIGATRGQIVRQLLSEAVALGTVGAAAGLLLAHWSVRTLLLLAPASLPRRESIGVDASVAAFAVVVSLAAVVAASLVPAWHAARTDVAGMLKQDVSGSPRTVVTRGLLVAAQLALSLILLVAAGLMTRAFVRLRAVPLGFEPAHTVSMDVALGLARFRSGSIEEARAARLDFYHRLTRTLRSVSGVQQVGFAFPLPFSGRLMNQPYAVGAGAPEHQAEGIIALGGFLEMLHVPLISGRYFTEADDDRPVAIVDERLARESSIGVGQRLILSRLPRPVSVEVVGIVPHVQTQPPRAATLPQIWVTYATRSYGLSLVVRSPGPTVPVKEIERTVLQAGPGRPVHDVRMLSEAVASASSDTRFALFVLGTFAMLALALTGVGVYGSVAYMTSRRTREIAVRRALGARASALVSAVVRDSAGWTIAGLAAGIAGSLALSRYLSSLLFQVGARDPLTFAIVVALLGAVAFIATLVPAIRAVRVDPMLALRSE
jgi:putative ABC transport system permease protein